MNETAPLSLAHINFNFKDIEVILDFTYDLPDDPYSTHIDVLFKFAGKYYWSKRHCCNGPHFEEEKRPLSEVIAWVMKERVPEGCCSDESSSED